MLLLCQKERKSAVKKMIFLIILCAAAFQDIESRCLDGRFLTACTCVGIAACLFGGGVWPDTLFSAAVGLLFLAAGKLTSGGIGVGDGWFFIITGLFLESWENVMLAGSGLTLCFLFCLMLFAGSFRSGKSVRKRKLPFLPFLLPGGIWIAFH